ncbi:hypothetical protein B484DRAFT_172973, partial [Ochromonadaceae sp. CCMP2298]
MEAKKHITQRVPMMQLMQQASQFTAQRRDTSSAEFRKQVEEGKKIGAEIPGYTQVRPAPVVLAAGPSAVLDPNYKPPETVAPAKPNVSKTYKSSHTAPTTVGRLFEAADPNAVPGMAMPSKRMIGNNASNKNGGLIGGYDSEDRWQTTTQSANDGDPYNKGGPHCKKRLSVLEPEDMISPITGERVADYGTWAEDLKLKRAAQEAEEESSDEEVQDPLLSKLKTQFGKRGSKGASGLHRIFKVIIP